MIFEEEKLLPCPFCGGQFIFDAVDRLIVIKCKPCKYSRAFGGLLQAKPRHANQERVPGTGIPEYYHRDAHERAVHAMNKRANDRYRALAAWGPG